MNKFLEDIEQRVALHLKQAAYLQSLPMAIVNANPGLQQWSACRCLWHLNSYGEYYLPKLEEGIAQQTEPAVDYQSSWLGNQFTKLMEPKVGGMKFKAFKKHVPPSILDDKKQIEIFIQQCVSLQQLLAAAKTKNLNAIKIPITIAPIIKLNAGDVIQFLVAHNERHLQQACRAVDIVIKSSNAVQ